MQKELTGTAVIAGPLRVTAPKTPPGELRRAILDALKGEDPILSADLRKKIIDDGYDHPINLQYFTTVLRALVDDKLVKKTPNGAYSTYVLAPAARHR